jgi:quinol monooxygenase YgiN
MFVRTTRFKVKQGSISRLPEITEGAKEQVLKMDGLLHSYSCVDDAANGLLIGLWQDEQKAGAASARAKAIWESIAEHLDGELQVTEYRTVISIK